MVIQEPSAFLWISRGRPLSEGLSFGPVSYNLVRKMIYLVGIDQISIDRAAELLSKPCSCGVFNPTPAVRILNDIHQGTYFASPG